MLAHGSGIVSNLLEMITTCDNASEHTPFLEGSGKRTTKSEIEGNHIKYHLYKVVYVYVCVL